MSSHPPIDILVIGAGPVGLSFALGAIHRGARNVIVAEQARAFRASGNIVNILPNGYRTLCAIAPGVRERMQPYMDRDGITIEQPGLVNLNPQGKQISQIIMEQEMASLYWWQLQRVLLGGLSGRRCVMLSHRLVDVRYDDNGIAEATFAVASPTFAVASPANMPKQWQRVDESVDEWDGLDEKGVVQKGLGQDDDDGYWKLFERVESENHEHGEEPVVVKCRASLVVAADGINSTARRCLYRDCGGWEDFAEASYSGLSMAVLSGPPNADKDVQDAVKELYLKGAKFNTVIGDKDKDSYEAPRCTLRVVSKGQNHLWVMFVYFAVNEHASQNCTDLELLEIVGEEMRKVGFPECLKKLMYGIYKTSRILTCLPNQVVPASHPPPYRELSTAPKVAYPDDFRRPWYHRRMVIIGDALHGMPPTLAQGTSLGLEDSLELLTKLEDEGVLGFKFPKIAGEAVLRTAFAAFKAGRMERVCTVQTQAVNRLSEYNVEAYNNLRKWLYTYIPKGVDVGRFTRRNS